MILLFKVERQYPAEGQNYPIGYDQGRTELHLSVAEPCGCLEMKGRNIWEMGSGYDPENPYEGRVTSAGDVDSA